MIDRYTFGKTFSRIFKDKRMGDSKPDAKTAAAERNPKSAAAEKKTNGHLHSAVPNSAPKGLDGQRDPEDFAQNYASLASVTKIYEDNKIADDLIGTIFMAEAYLKTLPDHLPTDVKRRTVLDLIRSTGVAVSQLCKDGERRKIALDQYLSKFSETTDRLIDNHQMDMRKLAKIIQDHEKAITDRRNLQEEQAALINYEVQRLQRVIDFLQKDNENS